MSTVIKRKRLTIGDKMANQLEGLGIACKLKATKKSPQLTTYYYNLVDSRKIGKVNEKLIDIIRDYNKRDITLTRGGTYSFSLSLTNKKRSSLTYQQLKQPEHVTGNINVAIGRDLNNKEVTLDFGKINHLLIAGTTGSGKSVLLNAILAAIVDTTHYSDFDLKLIDPKRVSFVPYKGLRNAEIITETEEAVNMLDHMIEIMENRYTYMEKNAITDKNVFKPIFIVVDELAELMLTMREECESTLIRLLQKSRQANMHVILATQRPTVDVVSGLVKAQCDTRICLKMASAKDSTTVLDKGIAYKLLGGGDGYIKYPYECGERRFQTAYVSDETLARIIEENS